MEKEDDGLYYGRVKSPNTYGNWEYGYFSREQLEEARAYRVDENIDDSEPVFPDGGYPEPMELYKPREWIPEHENEGEYRFEE